MAEVRPKWVDALDPTCRATFNETENSFDPMYTKIFHVMSSNKAFEKDTALSGPFFQRDRWKRMPGKLHTGETGEPGFSHPVGILGETFLAQ